MARHALPALPMCINFAGTGSLCLRHASVMARAGYALCFVSHAPLGLLLELRKAPSQHALLAISLIKRLKHNTLSSNGYGASPVAKSRRRAKGPRGHDRKGMRRARRGSGAFLIDMNSMSEHALRFTTIFMFWFLQPKGLSGAMSSTRSRQEDSLCLP